MQHQRFLVELDRRAVGVAVRMPGGFMFFSSEDDFDRLDGKLFPRARMLERALRKMIPPLGRAPAHRLAAA